MNDSYPYRHNRVLTQETDKRYDAIIAALVGPDAQDGLSATRLDWLAALLSEIECTPIFDRVEDPDALEEAMNNVRALLHDLRTFVPPA
jgi:hypothetical protein